MRFERAYRPVPALQLAGRSLLQAPWSLGLGGALLTGLQGAWVFVPLWLIVPRDGRPADYAGPWPLLTCCSASLAWPLFFALRTGLGVGFARVVERVSTHGEQRWQDVADGVRWLPAALPVDLVLTAVRCVLLLPLVFYLRGAPASLVLGCAASVLPVLYVELGLRLAPEAVAFEELGSSAALRRSWELVHGHRWVLLRCEVVRLAAAGAGLGLCCVGVLATGAGARVARHQCYLRLVRRPGVPAWWIDAAAPGAG